MRSIDFKDSNVKFAESQDEYITLSALRIGDESDTIITCWKLTWKERFTIFWTGIFWMAEMNFKRPLTPRYFSVNQEDVYTKTK